MQQIYYHTQPEEPIKEEPEEFNFTATPEQDKQIDEYHDLLTKMGYGTINEPNDLDQLFWDFGEKRMLLDKCLRVAIVENISNEKTARKFLGMAKRFNGWLQKNKEIEAKKTKSANIAQEERNKTLKDYKAKIREGLEKQYEAKRSQVKLEKHLVKLIKSKFRSADKGVFGWYNWSAESSIDGFFSICRTLDIKLRSKTIDLYQKQIEEMEKDPTLFLSKADAYNREWLISHNQHDQVEEDEDTETNDIE